MTDVKKLRLSTFQTVSLPLRSGPTNSPHPKRQQENKQAAEILSVHWYFASETQQDKQQPENPLTSAVSIAFKQNRTESINCAGIAPVQMRKKWLTNKAAAHREGPSTRPELLRTRPNEPNRTELSRIMR
jgi:hypothetical protein